MAEIKFDTRWLTAIGLTAKCGTPDDVMALCVAIQRASLGEEVGELPSLVELLFNPIAEDIRDIQAKQSEKQAKSERNRANAKRKTSENERPLQEKEREREEEGEAERETEKEEIPHTPLEEKDKEKGEEGEEEKEKEREALSCIALPEPTFIAETDPKKLTEKALEDEFNALWMLYPRKAGKSDALRHYKSARKNGTTYDEVEQGIIRYTRHIEDEKTDPQYIAMGSTWFCGHRWEDVYARHGPKPGSMEWLMSL